MSHEELCDRSTKQHCGVILVWGLRRYRSSSKRGEEL